jgi:hypothetical protein
MTKRLLVSLVSAVGLLTAIALPLNQAYAQRNTTKDFVAPLVFQAAGPTIESIQGTVGAFRSQAGAARSTGTAEVRRRRSRQHRSPAFS